MKKKQSREWRNSLVYPVLMQFSGLNEKKNKKLRKLLEQNMDSVINYYRGLLPKKERKKLALQSTWVIESQYPSEKVEGSGL